MSDLLLAVDVGATKIVLAVVDPVSGPRTPVATATVPSAGQPDLAVVIRRFLVDARLVVSDAVVGVPGPVVGGRARLTNLPWRVDAAALASDLGMASVVLLNDVQAAAAAVPHLLPEDIRTLQPGVPVHGGAIGVVAPGTGLGEAFLTWDGRRYVAHPAEGGHADFAPADPEQVDLLIYLRHRFGHVSYERVCSGSGLPDVYTYFRDTGRHDEPDWLAAALADGDDPTPIIVAAALDVARPCPICRAAVETFVGVLGAEAGNLALKVLATGGVYLAGGMPPRLLPVLDSPTFRDAFRRKGRYAGLLGRIPVHVITHPHAALLGAGQRAIEGV